MFQARRKFHVAVGMLASNPRFSRRALQDLVGAPDDGPLRTDGAHRMERTSLVVAALTAYCVAMFDGEMIILAMFSLNLGHPGRLLTEVLEPVESKPWQLSERLLFRIQKRIHMTITTHQVNS